MGNRISLPQPISSRTNPGGSNGFGASLRAEVMQEQQQVTWAVE